MYSPGFQEMINKREEITNNSTEEMKDFVGNVLKVNDTVLFPGGRELMKGVIKKIKITKYNSQAYVENESGYSKWKYSAALIKI